MKKISIIILLLSSLTQVTYSRSRSDSLYFLIDSPKVPVNDRMWEIHEEYPNIKMYTIKCPCLQYGTEPRFIYNIGYAKDEIIDKRKLKTIKLVLLTDLIANVKKITTNNEYNGRYSFFVIERKGHKFIVHEVRLVKISKPSEMTN